MLHVFSADTFASWFDNFSNCLKCSSFYEFSFNNHYFQKYLHKLQGFNQYFCFESFETKSLTRRNCYLGVLCLRFCIFQKFRNESQLNHYIKTLRKSSNAVVPVCITTLYEKSSLDALETKVYFFLF